MRLFVNLRAAAPADRPFVERVYFGTQRWLIEKLFGWRGDEVERAKFNEFYDEQHTQIVQMNGESVGWLTILREPERIEVQSIYLLPEYQGHGLGTLLMNAIIGEAEAQHKCVTLSTAKINPARRLYERLGFEVVDQNEFKVLMECRPVGAASSSEPVTLTPYNSEWPSIFAREASALQAALEPFGVRGIEHVGSTAVPGMIAKPIVDMVVGVSDVISVPTPNHSLWSSLDYDWGHGAYAPEGWLYFVKRDKHGVRVAQLHVVLFEGAFWNRIITFRDALRGDARLAEEYRKLKTALAAQHGNDRLRYRDEKAYFVARVLTT